MNPDLEKLIQLQHVESELKRAESGQADLPRRRQETEGALAEERGRLDAAKEALDSTQKARRRLEAELQDLELKRSKYKTQLMDVKTNKEYTAMLHEIEAVEREIRGREDLILVEMEKAETAAADVKGEEALFKAADARAKTTLRALEEEAAALKREVERLAGERDQVAATLPEDALSLFQRVAKRRGSGLSEARDELCSECHLKLRPQMYVELRRNDQIVQCPNCSRILYFVPVAAVQPQ
ncbi:MAG TPA: C4-type zinc ribbon domain-containing protein [Myxococcales bacterium]|nr:C4-type zinc ribbon domain-containing protein [Myxococcales bacterium]